MTLHTERCHTDRVRMQRVECIYCDLTLCVTLDTFLLINAPNYFTMHLYYVRIYNVKVW